MTISELSRAASADLAQTLATPGLWGKTRADSLDEWRTALVRKLAEVRTGGITFADLCLLRTYPRTSLTQTQINRALAYRDELAAAHRELPRDYAGLMAWADDVAGRKAA